LQGSVYETASHAIKTIFLESGLAHFLLWRLQVFNIAKDLYSVCWNGMTQVHSTHYRLLESFLHLDCNIRASEDGTCRWCMVHGNRLDTNGTGLYDWYWFGRVVGRARFMWHWQLSRCIKCSSLWVLHR
jgi:hypothetical protein